MQTTAPSVSSVQSLILKTMQPQPTQNMYVQPASVNNSNQVRANQTSSLFRGPPSSPAPRGGPRHVPMPAMYQQTMHQGVQGVVVQPYAQYPRQAFAAQAYSPYSQPMQPNYSYSYPSYYTVPQQRSAVGVNSSVSVGNTMPVQAGPNGPISGPPGASQTQIPLAPGTVLAAGAVPPGTSSSVLGVAPSSNRQQVGIPPMVGVVPTTVPIPPAAKPPRRSYRLKIIDPLTNKNILDDYNAPKNSTNIDVDYAGDQMYVQSVIGTDPLQNVSYDILDVQQMQQRDVVIGQTPVVSAISDAPSVEILPTTQKPRSKKIPIVNPKDEIHSVSNTESLPHKKQQQHLLEKKLTTKPVNEEVHTFPAKSDCVQHQLPSVQQSPTCLSHQVPQITPQQQQKSQLILTVTKSENLDLPLQTCNKSDISEEPAASSKTTAISTSINQQNQPQVEALTNSQTPHQNIQNQIQQEETPSVAINIEGTPSLVISSPIVENSVRTTETTTLLSNPSTVNSNFVAPASIGNLAVTSPDKSEILQTVSVNVSNVHNNMQLTGKEVPTTAAQSVPSINGSKSNRDLFSTAIASDRNVITTANGVVLKGPLTTKEISNNNNSIPLNDVVDNEPNSNNTNSSKKTSQILPTDKLNENSEGINQHHSCQHQLDKAFDVATAASVEECDETDRVLQEQQMQSASIENKCQQQQKFDAKKNNVGVHSPSIEAEAMELSKIESNTENFQIGQCIELAAVETNKSNVLNSFSEMPVVELSAISPISTTPQPSSQSLISYNEGQWSPNNPTGKKQYDREQLLQLREVKASRKQPDINNVSILPTSNLMPSFVRNPKRVQSMLGSLAGNRSGGGAAGTGAPGAEGCSGGGYGGKQASVSGVHSRGSMKAGMIHVNLSLNQDVKLNETDNAWRPRVLDKSVDGDNDPEVRVKREKDELIRRVRGILNKLTPEKFDALVEEIMKLKIDTPDKMEAVMVLVFEKAIDEPNFSVSYAALCHRLIVEVKVQGERMESDTKSNLGHFRSALLDKTEKEFTQNVTKSKAKEEKLQPIINKIAKCTDPVEKIELEAQLEEEERKIRRRSVGTVRFIGELFKISMLNYKIINSCIDSLLNPNSEDMLECLCKLLTTVGAKFEQPPSNSKDSHYSLDKIINRMQAIASKTDKEGAKISSRVRFMLQDVIDLRKDKWKSKRNEAPKTMGQVEKEMKTEQLSSQYLNYSGSVSNSGGSGSNGPPLIGSASKRDDRGVGRYNDSRLNYGGSHSQRSDTNSLRRQQQGSGNSGGSSNSTGGGHASASNDDNTWHIQTSKGTRSVDANKLEGLTTISHLETKKMGGLGQFQWKSPITAPQPPSNSFAVLSSLSDTHRNSDRDRARDRSGPRNKGSYNKGSIERDRYTLSSRSGSSQAPRENSSTRGQQSVRAVHTSVMSKSASHSKYTQQQMPSSNRMQSKSALSTNCLALYPQRGTDSGLYMLSTSASANQKQADMVTKVPPSEAPVAVFEKSSSDDSRKFESIVSEILEAVMSSKTFVGVIEPCVTRVTENQRCALLYYIMTDHLHLGHITKLYRHYLGSIVAYCLKIKFISVEHFLLAYKHFCEQASDLAIDIPELWKYVIEFTGPLISRKYITIYHLWTKQVKEDNSPSFGKKFLKTFLDYCLNEIGPCFTRTMWKKSSIKWIDFVAESEVKSFIETNKFEYLENESMQPPIHFNGPKDEHINKVIENIEHLLKEGATSDCIIDYINGNIVDNLIDKQFIRNLVTKLCDFAIAYTDTSYKLDNDCFQKICTPVLHRFIDSKEERELECLYSMQLLVHHLEHPRSLLSDLFAELYHADVIPQDSFIKWRDSKDQSAGKGVAVLGLNQFFNHLLSSETSDENN